MKTYGNIPPKPAPAVTLFHAALAAHQAGRLIEAEEGYRHVLSRDKRHADALYLLAVVHQQKGNLREAEILIRKALAVREEAFVLGKLGFLLRETKRLPEAEATYRRAIELKPDFADVHNSLGNLLKETKRLPEAEAAYRRALELKPDFALAHNNLANLLLETKRLPEAEAAYHRALELMPDFVDAYSNLGLLLQHTKRLPEAAAAYSRALELKPDYADAHNNLGILLKETMRLPEAEAAYRRALELKPDLAPAHSNLGNVLQNLDRSDEAECSFRQALALWPDYAEAHYNLGNALRHMGRLEEAEQCYRQAIHLRPDYADAYSNVLFLHAYHGALDPQDYLALARGWERACVPERERQAARERVFQRSPWTGRRLRLGYVSGDFRTHAVSYFVEQLFAHHDRMRIEVFAYSTCAERDAVTARLQVLVEHWVSVAGVPEAALRDRIEADGIDVLVDLSGHTGHNRLGVFARRAAPVQAHYLGYFASTGLTEMDYWIGDETLTPPETDAHYSEKIWRLPRVWVAYEGKADAPAPARRPAADDCIRVGGFNHLGKLTPATLALWAGVLRALPQARLLLKTKALAEVANRRRILDAMAAHGISSERIELRDISLTPDWPSHMACYDSLDIALDPVGGIAGGTTSCDALWMGVPVVTLIGDRMASRMTASMFRALGHEEWIAGTEGEYIQKVLDLARDAERRSALRFVLRSQMAESPLCDARGLAGSLEAAYFEMVERWQRRRTNG